MKIAWLPGAALIAASVLSLPAQAAVYVTLVQGLGGEPTYDDLFSEQSQRILEASRTLAGEENVVHLSGDDARRENLLNHFGTLSAAMTEDDRSLIYLIGHGSFDGEEYKFNIPGPDITTNDLNDILSTLPGRNHFLLNSSSTSGAILDPLQSDKHIIVTATRNGNERNATEFGAYFAEALSNEDADLNKNGNISVQEAFDYAARRVAEFFESSGRLATEHPQLRGNGAASLTLARTRPVVVDDGNPEVARLREELAEIDQRIEDLQLRRNEFSNQDYIQRLQALILESATINEEIDRLTEQNADGNNVNVQ